MTKIWGGTAIYFAYLQKKLGGHVPPPCPTHLPPMFVGIFDILFRVEDNRCEITYMYQRPQYNVEIILIFTLL